MVRRTYTVVGTYGSHKTECYIFVAETFRGDRWYVVEDSVNVNATDEEIADGVDVEEIADFDFFTAEKPVCSEEDLEFEVENF